MAFNMTEAKVKITAQTSGQESIEALRKQVEHLNESVKGIGEGFEKAKKFLATGLAAEAVKSLGEFVYKGIELGEQLDIMSKKFGVSVESLSMFRGAAMAQGVSLEQLGTAFKKLEVSQVQAADGNKKAEAAFRLFGANIKDSNGHFKEAGALMMEMADGIEKIHDPATKTAAAVAIFGKNGSDMIPVLAEGKTAIEEFGTEISANFAEHAHAFKDELLKVQFRMEAISVVAGETLMPSLMDATRGFITLTETKGQTVGFFEAVGEIVRQTTAFIGELYFALADVAGAVVTKFKQAGALMHTFTTNDKGQITGINYGAFAEVGRLQNERDTNQAQRDAQEKKFLGQLEGNSFLFGNGTVAQIRARQQASLGEGHGEGHGAGTGTDNVHGLGGGGSHGRKGPTPEEILKTYAGLLDGITQEDLKARRALTNSIQDRFANERDALASEVEKKKADIAAAKGLSATQKMTLGIALAKYDADKSALIAAQEADAIAKQKNVMETIGIEGLVDGLKIQESLANTAADRLRIQHQILDKEIELDRLKQQEIINSKTASPEARAEAAARLAQINASVPGRNAVLDGQNKNAVQQYGDSLIDTATKFHEAWANALKGTEDALVNFAMTGKLSIKDLANSIISDLVRIAIQQAIMKPLTGLFGGMFGGLFGSATGNVFSGGNIVPHANGGVVGGPTLFPMAGGKTGLMGEAGPEAIMPLKRLPSGALGVQAQNGGTQNVTVNVSVQGNTQTTGDQGNAAALGKSIANAVRAELVQQKRPGGLLAAA